MNVFDRINELAAERNLSLRAFAELCDVPYSTLKNAKKRGGDLQLSTLRQICKGLGIPLKMFFDEM